MESLLHANQIVVMSQKHPSNNAEYVRIEMPIGIPTEVLTKILKILTKIIAREVIPIHPLLNYQWAMRLESLGKEYLKHLLGAHCSGAPRSVMSLVAALASPGGRAPDFMKFLMNS